LLRPGGLPAEAIEAVLGVTLLPPHSEAVPRAPGMLPTHYAPRTPLVLVAGPPEAARSLLHTQLLHHPTRAGVLLLDEDVPLLPETAVAARVGSYHAPDAVATHFYDALRTLDRLGLDQLFARDLADPATGLGRALADRLRRAATRVMQA